MNDIIRELRRELLLNILKPDKIQEQDGGILVKDVTFLAAGTWTDSAVGTPLFYPEATLEKFAENWVDTSVWSRHSGKVPRSITDKIGEVRNPHYQAGAVKGDLWLHGKTTASRDTIALVKAGLVNSVSVEHGGSEVYNRARNRYEAESITFAGLAIVNKGACSTCTINNEAEILRGIEKMAKTQAVTEIVPDIIVRKNHLGNIELNFDKRRELKEKFEKDLGLEDTIAPSADGAAEISLEEPQRVRIRRGVWGGIVGMD